MSASAFRVFVSYSHEDKELVGDVVSVLKDNGLMPMYYEGFAPGSRFLETIKTRIAHAHVFMPVITESSSSRGWVHQEIGYAVALNVPVLPLVRGVLPGQMLGEYTPLELPDSIEAIGSQLSHEVLGKVAKRYRHSRYALYRCADLTEDRAQMLASYSDDVQSMGFCGCVRQKGGLSSFHIPDEPLTNAVWLDRNGGHDRGDFHNQCQREERIALERHAREEGCRIIVKPSIPYEKWGPEARRVRLQTLIEFLNSMPDDKAQVAVDETMSVEQSLTMVGNWFAAESVSATIGHGFRQTIFTRHAPSVESRAELFDKEFQELLKAAGWSAETSRAAAITLLNQVIEQIDRASAARGT